MKYIIKNTRIIHQGSPYHNKKVDIFIDRGKIVAIGKKLDVKKAQVIEGKNLFTSVGWVDVGTTLGAPGNEHRETFETLASSALAGGFTDLITSPKAAPMIASAPQIKSLINEGKAYGIDIHPLGVLSKDGKGENISEYIDMYNAGAKGYFDGNTKSINSGLLLRALEYAKHTDSVVMHTPNDSSLANEDLIHEGEISIQIGMKGNPSMAEQLVVDRDLKLAAYTKSKLALHLLSSDESVKALKSAKKSNDKLYAGVSYLNLIKKDEDVQYFDSNLKVKPVLRASKDQKMLIKGVLDGTIDYICSNHTPLEQEKKHLEYPYADHGAIGLETCFAALMSDEKNKISEETFVKSVTCNPRSIFGLPPLSIEENSIAKLTIFSMNHNWRYTLSDVKSLSKNTPFIDQNFSARVLATFNGKSCFILK